MKLIDLLNSIEVKELHDAVGLLRQILIELKGIRMDTSALNAGVSKFAADFSKFAADFATFISTNVPQDTPQQVADVQAAVDALNSFDAQVQALDATVNGSAVPPPPPPPPPPAG